MLFGICVFMQLWSTTILPDTAYEIFTFTTELDQKIHQSHAHRHTANDPVESTEVAYGRIGNMDLQHWILSGAKAQYRAKRPEFPGRKATERGASLIRRKPTTPSKPFSRPFSAQAIPRDRGNLLEQSLPAQIFSVRAVPSVGRNASHPIQVLIARTLSPSEVDEAILDILSMHEKPPTQVHWRLFCWARQTFDMLQEKLHGRLDELNVELVLKERVLKTYFWYNHLTQDSIPSTIDYVWLLDGDVILRNMAWDCYWSIIQNYQPAIVQPALIDEPAREEHNFWSAVSHPSACVGDAEFSRLVGIETSFVEQQAPMFRREAWITVRTVLDRGMGMWNHSKSSWGIDNVWCGIVQKELFNITYEQLSGEEPAIPYKGRDTCTVEHIESNAHRPIGCLIVHATPVVHIDTNTYDDKSRDRKNTGVARQKLYKSTFPQYFRYPCGNVINNRQCQTSRIGFHRSLWMDQPCQQCRQWSCTPYSDRSIKL